MIAPRSEAIRPVARGDIVLVSFPFSDLSATKRRPAAVLWADPAQADFTLAFISSSAASESGRRRGCRPTPNSF